MSRENIQVFRAFEATVHQLQAMRAVVVLRPKAIRIEAAFEGDYDFLFDPDRFLEILLIFVMQCRNHSVSLLVDQRAPHKKRISFISDNSDDQIVIELWPHAELTMPNRVLGGAAVVDWHNARRHFVNNDEHLELRVNVAAAIYITHLYHKQKALSSPEVQRRLAFYKDALSQSTDEVDGDLCKLLESLRSSTTNVETANMQAYAALLRMGVPVKAARILPLLQRVRRRLARVIGAEGGQFSPVPVMGPDGSGKTAIINALVEQEGLKRLKFKNVFRMSILYRGYHFARRKGAQAPVAKNLVDEDILQLILGIGIFRWWLLTGAGMMRSYVNTGAKRTVLVDRYFWDYLLRLRDAQASPERISGYQLFSKFVPKPHKAVVLCCNRETIHSRKRELTAAAIDYLYDLYCDQIARKRVGRVLMLSTDGPFERSYGQVARFVLADRAARSMWALARGQTSAQAHGQGGSVLSGGERAARHRQPASAESCMREGA